MRRRCDRRNRVQCDTKFITTDGCETFCSELTPSQCIGTDAKLLYCDNKNRVAFSAVRSNGQLQCDDQFLVWDAEGGCLTRKSIETSATLDCGSTLLVCNNGTVQQAQLGTAAIDCNSALLFCDGSSLNQAPMGTSILACDSLFLTCQDGALGFASVNTATSIACTDLLLVCDGSSFQLAPIGTAESIPDDAQLLFCDANGLSLAPWASGTAVCDEPFSFLVEQNGMAQLPVVQGTALECTDSFLVCSGSSLELRGLTAATSIACSAQLVICSQEGQLATAPVGTAVDIECDASFLVCQGDALVSAPLGTAEFLACSDEFLICDGSSVRRVPLGFSSGIGCADELLICQNDELKLAPVDPASSIACGDEFLICDGTSIRRARLEDGSCTVLDGSASLLVCQDRLLQVPLRSVVPVYAAGTVTVPTTIGIARSMSFVLTVPNIPRILGQAYKVHVAVQTRIVSNRIYPIIRDVTCVQNLLPGSFICRTGPVLQLTTGDNTTTLAMLLNNLQTTQRAADDVCSYIDFVVAELEPEGCGTTGSLAFQLCANTLNSQNFLWGPQGQSSFENFAPGDSFQFVVCVEPVNAVVPVVSDLLFSISQSICPPCQIQDALNLLEPEPEPEPEP